MKAHFITRYQLEHKIGELEAKIYWHERGTFPVTNLKDIRRELRALEVRLECGLFVPELNEHGNIIERWSDHTDRYKYDFNVCSHNKGWVQYDTDQDAWYFGVWVHPIRREILTYAEGDVTHVKCTSTESYKQELKAMNDFYGSPPPAFICIDIDTKTITKVYDERPE